MESKQSLCEKMRNGLPMLRASVKMTQKELAYASGLSRSTLVSVEAKRIPMRWAYFLSLYMVFRGFEASTAVLDLLEIKADDILKEIVRSEEMPETESECSDE